MEPVLCASTLALIVVLLALAIASYLISQRRPPNFPPGPWGFPFVGHLPLLGPEPHKTAAGAWKRKYGPLVGINFGSFPCVIISDYKMIREAFAMPAFSGRPNLELYFRRSGGRPEGIFFAVGRDSREQRSFTHRRLRELGGFGTKSMEGIIWEQVAELVAGMRQESGSARPVNTRTRFNVAILNTLWGVLAGKPFAQSDPEILRLTTEMTDGFDQIDVQSMLSMFVPWFGKWGPSFLTHANELERLYKPILDFLRPVVDEHWRTRTQMRGESRGQPRDFIDAYIDEITATTDPSSSFHAARSKYSLPTVLLDLFIAGSETSATSLQWTCLLLASWPEKQRRLVAEIEAVLGNRARAPSLSDRMRMPYTEAVIHEVLRFRPILPLVPNHSTTETVYFYGYTIPKGTMILGNTYDAHFDHDLWGHDAHEFRPERWLNHGEFVKRDGLLAFSTGKRVCLGEQMARDELFLFTVGLFQAFRVELDPNAPPPSVEPKLGGSTLAPKPHELIFKARE